MRKKIGLVIIILILSVTSVSASPIQFIEENIIVHGQDTIHSYKHEKTGLGVVWIENNDKKTCFTLGVKTPTTDSTGVNHIIEHSVFTGSSKYPSASLFFDANAIYPHIYMNASTSSDLTMYPFCTPYKESFEGLLNVYLDSILNPDMLNQPSNFYEEAFYYDPGTDKFGGVVYNEMKGAGSSAGRIIFRKIREVLYKDTHYANDSGGKVGEIPKLTYEEFVDTYERYYYPQNMMIILYGDLPIDKTLKTIDGYFDKYTEIKEPINVNVEPQFTNTDVVESYGGGEGAIVIKSFLIKDGLSSEQMAELDLWTNTYMLDPNSYFIKRLREQGIKNVEVYKDGELKYPIYSVVVSGIPEGQGDKIAAILDATVEEMKGLHQEEKEMESNTLERTKLSVYQGDKASTRGINIAQNMLNAWIHEKDFDQYYKVKEHIANLEDIEDGYKEILIGSPYVTDIQVLPREKEETKNPLELSPIQKDKWAQIVTDMRKWQVEHKESGLEAVGLKGLVLDNHMKYKKKMKDDIAYTLYQTDSELVSSELYFPTNYIQQENLPYLFLYASFLNQAAREISPFEGILNTNTTAIDNKEGYTPYIKINLITSKDNKQQDQLLDKARKNLLSKSDEWYKYQLDGFIANFIADFQSDVISTLTYLNMVGQEGSKRYIYEEYYPLYEFCLEIKKNGNTDFIEAIKAVDKQIGPRAGSYIGVVTDKETYKEMNELWRGYCKANRLEDKGKVNYTFTKTNQTNIYYKQTNVDYLLYSYDKGQRYVEGLDYLSASYITKNYLQPNIRVKKGAYGSSMNASFPNNISIYTYRDPEYQTSIDIINNMVPILKAELSKEKVEMAKSDAICDVQNQFGLLSTDMKKASILQILMIMGVDIDYVVDMQEQIVKSDIKDVNKQLDLMVNILRNSQIGICTNKATIPTQGELRMYNLK